MKKLIAFVLVSICSLSASAQKSQNKELQAFSSGKLSVYKVTGTSKHNYKFSPSSKPWPVQFTKDGDQVTDVQIKRAGIIEENYHADLKNYPAYYISDGSDVVVTGVNGKLYYYTWSVKSGSTIKYILGNKKPGKYASEKEVLDAYRRSVKAKQSGARDERIEEKKALDAKLATENTLNGKSIKSIKVVLDDKAKDIGLISVVSIGFEVVLTDGKVLKTKNLGGLTPYTDFDVKAVGGAYAGGDFKVAGNSKDIPNDAIQLTVKSKFGSSPKVDFSHPINYKNDIFYQFQGSSGTFGRASTVGYSEDGSDGKDGRSVTLQVDLQTINGEQVNYISISDNITGERIAEAKLHVESKLTINVSGGNGGSGANGGYTHSGNGGDGGNGGNGGSVTVYGNGASLLDLEVLLHGGNGGKGGPPKSRASHSAGSNGYNGSKGSLIK